MKIDNPVGVKPPDSLFQRWIGFLRHLTYAVKSAKETYLTPRLGSGD